VAAPSKPFSKHFQKSRVLLQAFPNKVLAVLWNFKGLQGFQTSFDGFQIFHSGRPLSAAFWALSRCIQLPRAVGFHGGQPFAWVCGAVGRRARSWGSDPNRENFQLSSYSGFWNTISIDGRGAVEFPLLAGSGGSDSKSTSERSRQSETATTLVAVGLNSASPAALGRRRHRRCGFGPRVTGRRTTGLVADGMVTGFGLFIVHSTMFAS
jgi:hypothetical protein